MVEKLKKKKTKSPSPSKKGRTPTKNDKSDKSAGMALKSALAVQGSSIVEASSSMKPPIKSGKKKKPDNDASSGMTKSRDVSGNRSVNERS